MPPPPDETLRWMLGGAIFAYAPLRDFRIEFPAGDFFARRAVDNIMQSRSSNRERFSAAVTAVFALPEFFNLMERTERSKSLDSENDAAAMIQAIFALRFPCVYPWCTA